jgi:hypothetical protein
MKLTITILLAALCASAQRCDSISASTVGGWKSAKSAPHDGTIVEMVQTYGIAPWYGIFKWTREAMVESVACDGKNPCRSEGMRPYLKDQPTWMQLDNPGHSVDEDACLFWRPYKGSGKYVDPTGGAQNSVAYWCAAAHRPYDSKTGYCK